MKFPFRIVFLVACCAVVPRSAGAGEAGVILATGGVRGDWAVDALLSYAIKEDEIDGYLDLLAASGVRILRERHIGLSNEEPGAIRARKVYEKARARGFRVLAFAAGEPRGSSTAWGGFPADLRTVYEIGRRQGRDFADCVDFWELHNEPELAWWPDMPDRYAAHAKALYLGLKAGARSAGRDTPVLLGALGLPAGPWLERSARNGLLAYADAWNIHYYGDPAEFDGFVDGHVAAMRALMRLDRPERAPVPGRWPVKWTPWRIERLSPEPILPIWATEVGINTVTPDTWADETRRRRQSDFVLATARQAWARPEIAVFTPFVLVHRGDGYAMTESGGLIWPAWEDYARFTREHSLASRRATREAQEVNPVVLQWLADAGSASGHKLGAVYRWREDGGPIRGELRAYNFGAKAVRGRLRARAETGDGGLAGISLAGATTEPLTIPAGGMVALPLSFALESAPAGGGREWREYIFEDDSGHRSRLGFGLERSPDLYPPEATPLLLGAWDSGAAPVWRHFPRFEPSEGKGPWRAINGARVLYAKGALARFAAGPCPGDPEYPPVVAARLPAGLPVEGWLRIATRDLGPAPVRVRVDLLDAQGRRFTQWENLGHVRGLPLTAPRWLNLADFHPYAWGKLDEQRRLKPSEVREIQLRLYATLGESMVDVELGLAHAYGEKKDAAGEVRYGKGEAAVAAPVE